MTPAFEVLCCGCSRTRLTIEPLLREHDPRFGLAEEEDTGEVDVDRLLPAFARHLADIASSPLRCYGKSTGSRPGSRNARWSTTT